MLDKSIITSLEDSVEIEKSKHYYIIKNMSERDYHTMRQAMKQVDPELDFDEKSIDSSHLYLPGHKITILDVVGRKLTRLSKTLTCRLEIALTGFQEINNEKKLPLWDIKKILYNYQ